THAARIACPAGGAAGEVCHFDPAGPAEGAFRYDRARVLPWVRLEGAAGPPWGPRRDLLASGRFSRDFVVEMDDDGRARLRFGDDLAGERPAEGAPLVATYRVGNGVRGNVGARALAHAVVAPLLLPRIALLRNPLPARGGEEPEAAERIRTAAPAAFRTPERAVTPDDYARMAERHPEVQRAQGTARWTGSWRTVFLTVDRVGGRPVDAAFEASIRRHLERYRMAGHDLEIDGPRFVPVEVALFVCVRPGYFRGDVERAVREALGSRAFADGRRGLFHPDRFTFGQSVYLSHVYAAVQDVPGVSWAEVKRFRRQDLPATDALASGELTMGRLEVARLDDDPSHPDRGRLALELGGGR
ncbi:MAG TPA: putative baseplate assembly protein, partial [Longimicrobium sp.]|nr:putative baseplate assembly protein [Longimicrobium sp.]